MGITDVQGAYDQQMPLGYAGQIADTSGPKDVASRTVENAAVPFGRAVGRGTADGSCRLGGSGYEGIAIADKTRTADQYAVGEVAGVMRQGSVWVTVGANVTPASTVYFVPATGVITSVSTDNTAIPGAKFETTATSGNLARVYLG